MFVEDLKKEFYDVILHERVLILVNNDTDAVCSAKILLSMFKCDNVSYTLIPVTGKKDMYTEYNNHSQGYKFVLLINCGVTLDLYEFLEPRDDVIIFVADYHRPVEVTNIYNDGQIRLLHPPDPEDQLPDYHDIFRDSESEESDSEDEFGEKRRKFDESALVKKRERREWEEKRQRILFTYTQYSFYGSSTALLCFKLAYMLKRDTNDLLWWSIVGNTEMYLSCKIEDDRYLLDASQQQNHVGRLNSTPADQLPKESLKINAERGLNLVLLRHWTLLDSIKHSSYTAMKFKLFSVKGERKLNDFLADLGIPLVESKQKYTYMDPQIRDEIPKVFEAKMDKYEIQEIFFNTFLCQFGYQHKYYAADVVRAVTATLEHGDSTFDCKQAVYDALDLLSRSNGKKLDAGIEKAKDQAQAVFKMAQNILEPKQIVSLGPFLYCIIQEGIPSISYLTKHNVVKTLAHFILQGHISNSRSKKAADLPLVLIAPLDQAAGLSVVVGIPPYNDKTRRNFFGKAFSQTVRNTQCRYLIDYWDSSLIQIKTEDKAKFIDGLISLLS
ncbi:cell division control protein 45 homolog [Eurytemora carolleeae]|uniref:cell division control protein 45 homolog n=1 Tax=Eurytemora carolleeae TaxID=1294199 RepID=UPI000C76D31D|nr:cell division control protein 45 homolog [Eurytemora carolleeae]|eukprot:XP_023341372.1 cell division control protein 45 homolog [Eurytemora affinis]